MGKIGRPKSIKNKQGRRHGVMLNQKAELIIREIKKQRSNFSLSRYLSERIIMDFSKGSEERLMRERIGVLNKEIDLRVAEIYQLKRSLEELEIKQ